LAHAPSAAQRLRFVEGSLLNRPGAAHEMNVVRPGKREDSCHGFEVQIPNYWFGFRALAFTWRVGLVKQSHQFEIIDPKSPTELTGLVGGQATEQHLPISRSILPSLLKLNNASADLPIGSSHQRAYTARRCPSPALE
jgi:hypothetical protein